MRSLQEIRLDIERATEQRAGLFHRLSQRHDSALAAEHARLEQEVAHLWEEHRAARAHLRFGERDAIIHRARAEERLERAA